MDKSIGLLTLLDVVRMDSLRVDLLITFEILGHLDVICGGFESLIFNIVFGLAHAHVMVTSHGRIFAVLFIISEALQLSKRE